MTGLSNIKQPADATAVIVLEDGSVLWGKGVGAEASTVGEICFNTSMTGYQEIMTDPSYAGQIVTFTFPHIGNTGANSEDIESLNPAARGLIVREDITAPSNWRAAQGFDEWLKAHNLPGICGIDTRALTRLIRDQGAPKGVLCHRTDGRFNLEALHRQAREWPGLDGMDLAKEVTCAQSYVWNEGLWRHSPPAPPVNGAECLSDSPPPAGGQGGEPPPPHVVAVDFGAKHNILRCLVSAGCKVTVVPATSTAEEILRHEPDGIFLSNGPGDPAATGAYAVPVIRTLLETGKPIFGICLGHQLLALALGAKTRKMHLGHRGANQPVQDLSTGKVEITSQNHGFEVLPETLPEDVEVSHISLFDGSNEGLRMKHKPLFSVQYHPEASPGPQDSHYLFERFVDNIVQAKKRA